MLKKVIREIYLLPRWEQKAILLFSLFLIAGSGIRVVVEVIPERDPPGTNEFLHEARIMMDSLELRARPRLLDLNRADSADLLPLPGIGPVFASRIIRYRDLLGG